MRKLVREELSALHSYGNDCLINNTFLKSFGKFFFFSIACLQDIESVILVSYHRKIWHNIMNGV